MEKKILVTGAGGFIGRALTAYLQKNGEQVTALTSGELDITDEQAVEALPVSRIGHIVHLAGKTFVPRSWEAPAEFIETNTFGTMHMLELCRKHKIPMTYISAYIYGQPERNPIRETDRVCPNNPYAKSKYMAEELCEFYARQFDVRVSVIRPFNVYGAGQKDNFLIPQIIRHAMREDSIRVMDLSPRRDYVYLEDLLEAITLTVKNVQEYDVFNIGSGVSCSVEEVIALIQRIAGTHKPVECKNEARKNELNDVVADISHAKEILGWQPRHTLEQGLTEMINGIRDKIREDEDELEQA